MIGAAAVTYLHEAIKIFDKYVGKDYLIACQEGRKHPIRYIVFRIDKSNFWHLLGCKVSKDITPNEDGETCDIYDLCLNGKDVSSFLNYTDTYSKCKDKYQVFVALFDFVTKAKQIRICDTNGTPDQYKFKMAAGNVTGIIGYDCNKWSSDIYFPKSTQKKSVDTAGVTSMRILYILSKHQESASFDTMEYSVSEKAFQNVIDDLPKRYKSCFRP